MTSQNYHEEFKQKTITKLRLMLKDLPLFMTEYFRGISDTTSPRTRLGYAYDLKIFFNFLIQEIPYFMDKKMKQITLEDLDSIKAGDIELFMEYLTLYTKSNSDNDTTAEYQNDEKGKSRKLASVRTLFNYFYKKQKITANPSVLVDMPTIHEKAITRLEVDEVAKLLDEIESGANLTNHQKVYHTYTHKRDLAIITLLLGTGIRVSECVGINISHIDFDINGIKITRKGGDEVVLYFGDEVRQALLAYMDERKRVKPKEGFEDALFLSLQNRRMTDRTIQLLVKKYSQIVTKLKKISPHKLRSTYGTNLYRETGDIYLVADVLGHKDVNTTRKHYAEIDEDRRRLAAKYVRLRNEE